MIRDRGSPYWPLNPLEWFLVGIAASSFIIAFVLWSDREYEFTGEEIIYRQRGTVRWRVPISALTTVRMEALPSGGVWAHLYSGTKRYSVFLVPELRDRLLTET